MDAQVHLAGNVGTPVDYRKGAEGQNSWAKFRLGHTPSYQKDGKWHDMATTWITVNCRRRLAWNVKVSLQTGDAVVVSGRLRTRSWTNDKTGELVSSLVIDADTVGHDLSRGTSIFRRPEKRPDPERQQERGGDDPWANREPGELSAEADADRDPDRVGVDEAGLDEAGPDGVELDREPTSVFDGATDPALADDGDREPALATAG